MDPNSSLRKICLGEDVIVISSDKVEGSGDSNSLELQDTANSGKKNETKAMVFYQMETKEVSDRFVAPCFVNGLEAYDGEINLGVEENIISNESFLCMTKAITDFGVGTIIIYPDIDPLLEETKEEEKSNDDWDCLLNFNIDDVPLLGEEGLPPFVCRMGKSSCNKKRAIENLNFFYQDIGTSSSAGGHLTQEEAAKEAIAIRMSQKLEGQVNENALADTGSDINTMPYRIYETLGREDMKKVDRGITMINHAQVEAMGILTNVLCQVGVTTLIAKFLILDILIDRDSPIVVGRGFLRTIGGIVNTPKRLFSTFDRFCYQTFRAARSDIIRNAESDSDDEEYYQIKRNKFRAPIYGPIPKLYLNSNNPAERSLVIETTMGTHDNEPGSSRSKRSRQHETVKEVLLPQLHHEFLLWEGCKRDAKSRMGCDGEIDDMLRIRLCDAGSDEEIFTSMAWIRDFNINEPIYAELCHEFYSTYEFNEVCADDELQTKKIIKFRLGGQDPQPGIPRVGSPRPPIVSMKDLCDRIGRMEIRQEAIERMEYRQSYCQDRLWEHMIMRPDHQDPNAQENMKLWKRYCFHNFTMSFCYGKDVREMQSLVCADDELQTKKIIKFRLGGRAHNLTLLEFARRLTLYQAVELEKEGFNVYFEGAWVIARWMKRKGAITKKESQIYGGQFISKIARKCNVLTDEVVRSLSALIYCRDLDMITLKELTDSDGKLIPEDPQPGIPKVDIPKPPRVSMQDLCDRMGRMEIRQEAIERMEYKQSYHQDKYQ
nr:hypothetical protein [Tanacetum cinerariifolium]